MFVIAISYLAPAGDAILKKTVANDSRLLQNEGESPALLRERFEDRKMYVCICNAVTDSQILAAVDAGHGSLKALRQHLGVAAECGRCARCAADLLKTCQGCGKCSQQQQENAAPIASVAPPQHGHRYAAHA